MQAPTSQAILREGFTYDHYANSAWLEPLLATADEESIRVFKHVLGASEIWSRRVEGVSLPKIPDLEISRETMDSLRDRWLSAVEAIAYDEPVSYCNTLGAPFTRNFGDIAQHVLMHGTYHRGQIRQIFGSKGLSFPDTDFILFSFSRDEWGG